MDGWRVPHCERTVWGMYSAVRPVNCTAGVQLTVRDGLDGVGGPRLWPA